MDPSVVGLQGNSRANPEASRPAVNISSAVKWFHARREVCDLREEPRRSGTVTKIVDRCRDVVTAPPHDGTVPQDAYHTAVWTADGVDAVGTIGWKG